MQDISVLIGSLSKDYKSVHDQFKTASLSAFELYFANRGTAMEKEEYNALNDVLGNRISFLYDGWLERGEDWREDYDQACDLKNILQICSTFDQEETGRFSKYIEKQILLANSNLVSTYKGAQSLQHDIMASSIRVIKNAFDEDKDREREREFLGVLNNHLANSTSYANSEFKLNTSTSMPDLIVAFDVKIGSKVKEFVERYKTKSETKDADSIKHS